MSTRVMYVVPVKNVMSLQIVLHPRSFKTSSLQNTHAGESIAERLHSLHSQTAFYAFANLSVLREQQLPIISKPVTSDPVFLLFPTTGSDARNFLAVWYVL